MLKDRSLSAYQAILETSFKSQFPQWDSMSPWDPVKMIAEAMTHSLSAIEQRHDRLVSTLMDSLPSLLAFESQPALLPGARLSLEFSAKLKEVASLKKGTVLRFAREEGTLFASLKKSVEAIPEGPRIFEVEAELFEKTAELHLGSLKGEPWEMVALPDSLVGIPESVLIRFPDERTVEIQRQSEALLVDRHSEPGRFQFGFFYNAASHALVIPCCHEHLEGYEGGVILQAHQAIVRPQLNGKETGANFCNDFPKILQSAHFEASTHAFIPRESAARYMERFYSLVREIPRRKKAGFFPEEICLGIASLDSRIRNVEFALQGSKVVFFLLEAYVLAQSEKEELLKHTADYLAETMPLSLPFEVDFFRATPLEISLQCEAIGVEKATHVIERLLQPSPIGSLQAGGIVSIAQVRAALSAESVASQSVRMAVGVSGQLQDKLMRQAGERFGVKVVAYA